MATEEPIVATEVTVTAETVVTEEKPAVKVAEGKPKKAKKTSAKGKPRSPSLHPPYFEMIKEAIVALKEKTGSSQHAITKFIQEKHKSLPENFKKMLFTQLKKSVAAGKLVKVKASYKLPATKAPAAAAPVKKKAVAKPKTAAKPKPAAKKAPAKKKVAAKPKAKPVSKAKSVAKPKAAAKPKTKPASKAKTAAKQKTVASKAVAKPAAKAKPVKAKKVKTPAKVARTSAKSAPGKATARKVKK